VRNPQYAGHTAGRRCYLGATINRTGRHHQFEVGALRGWVHCVRRTAQNNDSDTAPARGVRFIETAGGGL
jgi:hypothetical protein